MYVECYKTMKVRLFLSLEQGSVSSHFVQIYCIDHKGTEGHRRVGISFVSECVKNFHTVFADIFNL